MNIAQIKRTLPILFKHKIAPFIWGMQGQGKTQVVKQLAAELGIGFVPLYLGTQSDMGDLLGLLKHNADGTVGHARPEWMPSEGKGIIFLDEFNRAHPDIFQGMYSFLQTGRIHNHQLGAGWHIVAAGNYQNNNFTVTDMSDSAMISRFCHLDFKPTVEEFITFAESKGATTVASFAREQPTLLGDDVKQSLDLNMVKPDRRAFLDVIGKLENEDLGEMAFEVYAGCLGASVASAFITHKNKKEKALSINDVLTKYSKVKKQVLEMTNKNNKTARFDLLNTATAELLVKLEKNKDLLKDANKLDNLKEFILDIPAELGLKVFKDMKNLVFTNKDAILNDVDFVKAFVAKSAVTEGEAK